MFISDLNTCNDNEPDNSIPESDEEDEGVKVLSENQGDRENNFEEEKSWPLVDGLPVSEKCLKFP